MRGFVVAGTASGVGKTTVTLAVIAAMRRRGMAVQAFKGGPDFLDTGHLTRATRRPARNVDTWMMSVGANRALVASAARGADVVVAEGMMGLFDGKDAETDRGSTAEIAKVLGLPVVLVLDAGKIARSIAALVLGFESFDPELKLAGVVLNRVAGERHYRMLEAAIRARCATPVLGWLPREAAIAIPERHLGLQAAQEFGSAEGGGESATEGVLADLAESSLDMERVLGLTCEIEAASLPDLALRLPMRAADRVRIGVARDRAFCFLYEDNLDLLRAAGAELVEFSPVGDAGLPEDLDALYLGGGYPELYASPLSANGRMLNDVRGFVGDGGVVYAECGGMLYLGQELTTLDGTRYPMAGVLPIAAEMTEKLVKFGYVTVKLERECLLGAAGLSLRGHSFHYSKIRVQEGSGQEGSGQEGSGLNTVYRMTYSLSGLEESEGFAQGSVLASYAHLHFGTEPAVATNFVAKVREAKAERLVRA